MSTTPDEISSVSRQRVSRACDLCRKKKVKCDGATPVCTNCKGVDLECTFKDMTKKRGPPKGYIEAIENRLYKLENFLGDLAKDGNVQSKQLLSELNSPLETPSGEQIRARPVRRAPRSERNKVFFWQQDKAGKRKRESLITNNTSDQEEEEEEEGEAEEEPMDQINSSNILARQQQVSSTTTTATTDEGVGQLAMDENGQVRYLGKSSGYYLLQNSKTYQNGAFHFANYGKRPRTKQSSSNHVINPFELPPKDLSEHLIVIYFRYFHPFLPLFYKRQLFSTLHHPDPTVAPISPLLLNAIYAVASRISPDVRVRADPALPDTAGDIYFERAEKLLDESYDTPLISTVQALLLLASHQHGRMKSARAWLYSGMAFRMAQDLGLHRNCDNWNIPPDECERRKRVFWCCYVADRLTSAMYGRASTFEERDCDVPFPSIDDPDPIYNDNPGEPPIRLLEAFTNLIKICDILGHVLKNIYYVRSLQNTGMRQADTVLTTWNKKLHQWYDHLPSALQIDHTMPPAAICQLHMIYHTTVILLHRPFIPAPNQSLVPSSLLPCASICASAAESVLSIAQSMLAESKLRYVMNYCVYYIFTTGIIFIKSACAARRASDYQKAADAKLKALKCMQALDEVEQTWTTASKSCHILAELSGHHLHGNQQQQQWSEQQQQQHQHTGGYIPAQQHLQHQLHPSSSYSPSPHSSASVQPPLNPSPGRNNTSDLRFPVLRLGSKPGQQEYPDETSTTQDMDFAAPNPFLPTTATTANGTGGSTMDPFAAPGIIPVTPTRQQIDPLDNNAFWGVPSSLDENEWGHFMLNNQAVLPFTEDLCLQDRQLFEAASSTSANTSSALDDYSEKQHLIHTDQNVDVLSGVPSILPQHNTINQQMQPNPLPLPLPQQGISDIGGRPITTTNGRKPVGGGDLANAYYW